MDLRAISVSALACALIGLSACGGEDQDEPSATEPLATACAQVGDYSWEQAYYTLRDAGHPRSRDFESLWISLSTGISDDGISVADPGGDLGADALDVYLGRVWDACTGHHAMPSVAPLSDALGREIRKSREAWEHMDRPACAPGVELGMVAVEETPSGPEVTGLRCMEDD